MKINQILKVGVVALLISFGKLTAQTVYITESGKKYHQRNCHVAKTGKKGIELADAKKQGYNACSVCFNDD